MSQTRFGQHINQKELDALFAPTAIAQGLPGRFYVDDLYWEFEQRAIVYPTLGGMRFLK